MAGRPYWTGHIRFALVSIPVQVVPATKTTEQPSFHQIHEPSGKRIRYEKVVPGIGPVDTSEIVKGYEVDKGKYVLLTDEEIDDIKLEAKKVVDLTQFVSPEDIDATYFEKPYFVLPDEGDEPGREAYVVLREALKSTGKIGLGQLAVRGRSSLVAVMPHGDGLLLEMLRYQDELRKTDPSFAEIKNVKPDKELVQLAEELIERKSGPFKPEAFRDKYVDALNELIEAKLADRPPENIEEPTQSAQVIDLMEALKRSIKGGGEKPVTKTKGEAKAESKGVNGKAKVTKMRPKSAALAADKPATRSTKVGASKKKTAER
jgi:DNA end-binding protein Ku